jgi:hypothetical protein
VTNKIHESDCKNIQNGPNFKILPLEKKPEKLLFSIASLSLPHKLLPKIVLNFEIITIYPLPKLSSKKRTFLGSKTHRNLCENAYYLIL